MAKVAPFPVPPLDALNGTTVELDEGFGDRETESEAAELSGDSFVALLEGVEKFVDFVGRNADAGVLNLDSETVVRGDRRANRNGSFRRRKLRCVLEKVPENLLEAGDITSDMMAFSVEFELDGLLFFIDVRDADVENVLERQVRIDGFEIELDLVVRDAREVEEIINQPGFQFGVATDHFQIGANFGRKACERLQERTVASTGVSGVRNSWLRTARKSSLARLAASSSA